MSALQDGLSHHQAGRLSQARTCYCEILQTKPQHPDALHLLGVIAQQIGKYEAAVQLISAAIRYNPQAACYHTNLGNTYRRQGDLAAAIASYRQALALDPSDGDTQHSLATLLAEQGELQEAMECYERVLALQPNLADAHYNLGNVKCRQGDFTSAADCYRRAIALRPECTEYHHNLATALQEQGALPAAADSYRAVLALDPGNAETHYSLGVTLHRMGDLPEAARSYARAIELKPSLAEAYANLGALCLGLGDQATAARLQHCALAHKPEMAVAHVNLGVALSKQNDDAGALDCFRQAVACEPDYALAHCNVGFALEQQGNLAGAQEYYRRALEQQPDFDTARFYLAITHLLQGDFAAGWEAYEARWGTQQLSHTRRDFSQPLWRGEPLKGARILLHAEQGLGDTMQFVRYVPLVAARGGQVLLEVQPGLRRLLDGIPGAEQVLARGEALPEFSWQCPLLSLPLAFGTNVTNIPASIPYLHPDKRDAAKWAQRLQSEGLRVGLVWGGSPTHVRERQRSIPLEKLALLLQVEGTTFYSLQKGPAAAQIRDLPGIELIDLDSQQKDFADTAAIVANLDLVISIDTSVAHLAGAMGKPVWILLHSLPDWRWLLGRDDSPWYPTARLFRQTEAHDWTPVLDRVRRELDKSAKW